MKRNRRKGYGYYFWRHFRVMILVWTLLIYVFLQVAFFIVYSKLGQKSSVNFYEGMESIQYVMKDADFREQEVEVKRAMDSMSDAGLYYLNYQEYGFEGYPGMLLGIRLGWLDHFAVMFGGHSTDGHGNTRLYGFGKAWWCIQDAETDEVVSEMGKWKDMTLLYVEDLTPDANIRNWGANSMVNLVSYYRDILACGNEELDPIKEKLYEVKEAWMERYRQEGRDLENGTIRWYLDGYYKKEDSFYPAKLSLRYIEKFNSGRKDEERIQETVIDELTFEPKEKEGYVLHEIDEGKERAASTFLFYDPTRSNGIDLKIWTPDDDFKAKALSDINGMKTYLSRSDIGEGWLVGNPLLYFLNGEMVFARFAYFQDASGHLYKACTYQNFSGLWDGNKDFAIGWGIYFAVMLTILAALTAYTSYLRNKHVLITQEYREILVDSMAHDLKSPLMVISGYAENLREHTNEEKRDHYAEEIQKSVAYMNDIVMKNLEILKYDKVKRKHVREDTDLRKLFEDAFARYEGEVEKRDLHVTIEGELSKNGDEELLQKVAENLVTNAIRYTPDGGNIKIVFEKNRFFVQNDTEIEYKGKLNHLWEPFVRGEDSRTGRGTGLGLAIVSNVLDRHAWKYTLRYDKETKKFTCIVKIPMGIF